MQHASSVVLCWYRCDIDHLILTCIPENYTACSRIVSNENWNYLNHYLQNTVLKIGCSLTDFEAPSRDWFDALFRSAANWKLHRDDKPSWKTFPTPPLDHRRGSFLYFSTSGSAGAVNKKSAILESKILRSSNRGSCVSFWYRISGRNAGALELKRVKRTGTDLLWKRDGEQKEGWKYVKVAIPINPKAKYYQLIIEANLGSDGSMALDDIDLDENHSCTNSLENGGFVVDFENKVTSMKNKLYGDHFDWVIKNATSSGGGPPTDVTSGMGHYLLLKTYGKRTGQKASYVSNGISPSDNGACLSFYYFINGQRVGKLAVSILSKSGWLSTAKILWSNTGNQSGNWKFAKVSLPKTLTSQSYDIMFTGTVGTDNSGSMAIDDITLKNTGVC